MEYQDSLQDRKGVNAETDRDGVPSTDSDGVPYIDADYSDIPMEDKQNANVPSLLDALRMHNDELKELSAEVGRSLTVLEAHTYRIRKLKDQLITKMLEEE